MWAAKMCFTSSALLRQPAGLPTHSKTVLQRSVDQGLSIASSLLGLAAAAAAAQASVYGHRIIDQPPQHMILESADALSDPASCLCLCGVHCDATPSPVVKC